MLDASIPAAVLTILSKSFLESGMPSCLMSRIWKPRSSNSTRNSSMRLDRQCCSDLFARDAGTEFRIQ